MVGRGGGGSNGTNKMGAASTLITGLYVGDKVVNWRYYIRYLPARRFRKIFVTCSDASKYPSSEPHTPSVS